MGDQAMLTKINGLMLADAFAPAHRSMALSAGEAVVRALTSRQWTERFAVQTQEQGVLIPARLYFATDRLRLSKDDPAWGYARALQTRSSDGFLRQAAARDLIGDFQPWATPFIVALIGEYIVEILEDIAAGLTPEMTLALAAFIAENPAYWRTTKRRVMSYWDAYYRHGGYDMPVMHVTLMEEASCWSRVKRHMLRYWNVGHRHDRGNVMHRSYRRDEYIGFKLIDRLDLAVTGQA